MIFFPATIIILRITLLSTSQMKMTNIESHGKILILLGKMDDPFRVTHAEEHPRKDNNFHMEILNINPNIQPSPPWCDHVCFYKSPAVTFFGLISKPLCL